MSKNLASIDLAAPIAFALIVLAPMMASAQVTITPAVSQSSRSVIRAATPPKPPTAEPKVAETAKDKARECSREAGAKGLQGKPRKTFLKKCKEGSAAE